MGNRKPAILWDLDGTIFDTKACHFKSWKYALNQYGFDLDLKKFEGSFGQNNHASLSAYLGFDLEPDFEREISEVKETYFREIALKESKLVPGVTSWLLDAKDQGFSQAIASSAPIENIQILLGSFDLLKYFDQFISGEDLPPKPNPDVFLEAARVLGQEPEECWVIEDALLGITAAKNAGMKCVAVATYLTASELAQADLVVEDFTRPFKDIFGISQK